MSAPRDASGTPPPGGTPPNKRPWWRGVPAGAWKGVNKQGHVTQDLVFRQLVLQWKIIRDTPQPNSGASIPLGDTPLGKGIQDLIDREKDEGCLSWLELYDLESLIIRVLDDARLRDEAWSVREEFRNLATEELYKAYTDSNPKDPRDPKTDPAEVRRDVESLLRKLHELRIGRSFLDIIRAYTTGVTFAVTLLLILAALLAGLVKQWQNFDVLLLVVVGGVFGAGISMLQRLSLIPSKGDLVARHPAASRRLVWILTPLISLTQGALAAIALYFIFRAGLLKGIVFPNFPTPPDGGPPLPATQPPFDELFHGTVPNVVDAAKLLVWSLVAGTAERLVPDLLTRLSDQARTSQVGSNKPA